MQSSSSCHLPPLYAVFAYLDQGVLMKKFGLSFFVFVALVFFALALVPFFLGAAFPLVPILAAPMPPASMGLGPFIPPIPAIFPCSALSVGPAVTGMKAEACATSRMAATMHLTKVEEENMLNID